MVVLLVCECLHTQAQGCALPQAGRHPRLPSGGAASPEAAHGHHFAWDPYRRVQGVTGALHFVKFVPGVPQYGPGLHVVGVAMVVASLLKGGAHVIDHEISETGIIPKLMGWAVTSPISNPLQSLCLRIFRHSMVSKIPLLWTPLVQRAMGLPEEVEVLTEDSLQVRLVELGRGAVGVPIGQRSPAAGFAITLAQLLRAATSRADVPPEVQEAQEALRRGDWHEYCARGGDLDQLLSVQRGELCGPRPPRDAGPLPGGGAIIGGQLLTQQDLMRLAGRQLNLQNLAAPPA
eukprot:jgi/Botrbrau1/9857/Bobra.0313s0026.1